MLRIRLFLAYSLGCLSSGHVCIAFNLVLRASHDKLLLNSGNHSQEDFLLDNWFRFHRGMKARVAPKAAAYGG